MPTIENFIEFKRVQSVERRAFIQAKKDSWRNYVSTISSNVTAKEVFQKIRRINGNKIRPSIKLIQENNKFYTDQNQISEVLAVHYENISSNRDLKPEDLLFRSFHEAQPLIIPEDSNSETYNLPISMAEIKYALAGCKGSSPGPDNIHYDFLKHLNKAGFLQLLRIYNKIWSDKKFPKSWNCSFAVPSPKQGKDFSLPNNTSLIAYANLWKEL